LSTLLEDVRQLAPRSRASGGDRTRHSPKRNLRPWRRTGWQKGSTTNMTSIQGLGVYEQDADRFFEKSFAPPLLKAALIYAAAGLAVFPLNPRTKLPATKRGFYDATTNPETIRRFWRVADRNIGIATGAMSGFWVLDIDPGGEDHIRRLEAEHGKLPLTRKVTTGRSGRHLWLKYTEPIQCSAGRVAPHVDVRGDLGYCVSPPSIHENGRRYEWLTDPATPVASAPEWLVALTRKKPPISERACALAVSSMKALSRISSSKPAM
jgi:hypothetical protein